MSTFKLQKLCYYSQAWHVTLEGEPLFHEKVYAWVNGPVVRELYNDFRGRYTVRSVESELTTRTLKGRSLDVVDQVIAVYGDLEPGVLVEWTHREDPWRDARGGLGPRDRGESEISTEAMRDYYSRRLESGG